jgi:crotonobetainyl-CoA:carnitine CoA-transferase CaiB-like acyl-CoA transferase
LNTTDTRPFKGIKVLDVTRVLASPFTSGQLAFLGADVIKIEDPGSGDAARYGHSANKELAKSGMSSNFLSQNANKRSITLNLRTPEGQTIFRTLAQDADVIIQNLRTGTMDRYGLGFEDLRKANPRIVYCSLTAYGATGPKKRHPAYDPVVQAASGMMSINGTAETVPLKVGPPVVDYATGLAAAFAIATALFQRGQTGQGQHIDVSMLDTAFVLMGSIVTDVLTANAVPRAHGNTYVSTPTNACFKTSKGLLYIAAMQDHHVRNLCRTLGRPDIPLDARFATAALRSENFALLRAELEKSFLTRTATEWEDLLNEASVPAMRVRTIPEALAEPYLESRNLFRVFDEVPGVKGSVTVPLVPFKMSSCEVHADLPPPMLGAHTEEILQSIGYSASQLEGLREKRVI